MQFKNFTFLLLGLSLASAFALPPNELLNSKKDELKLNARSENLAPPSPAKTTTPPKPTPAPLAPKPSPPKPNPPPPAPKPNPPKPNPPSTPLKPSPTKSNPPSPPPNKKAPRSFTTIKASPDAWKRYGQYCSQKARRSLERRADVPKSYGSGSYAPQDGSYKSGSKIWTDQLRSCTGLVIQGKLMGVALTSYLVHFSTTAYSLDEAMGKLETQIKGIRHDDIKAYISEPETTKELPPQLNTPEDKKLMEDVGALIRERVQELIGRAPVTRKHGVTAYDAPGNKVNGYMWVDENNQVFIDGNKVS